MLQRNKKSHKNVWIISVIAVVCAFLLMLNSGVTVLQKAAGFVVWPFEKLAISVGHGISSNSNAVFQAKKAQEERDQLEQELTALQIQKQVNSEVDKENQRKLEMLGYLQQYPKYTFIDAAVISFSPDDWSYIIVIDKGSKDGITIDMPVVAKDGLVGRIFEVSENFSKVITIIDSRSKFSGIVERSRDTGIIQGVIKSNTGDGVCQMLDMPFTPSIQTGDEVITSGRGGVFPKGIVVGEVTEVSLSRSGLEQYATIQPVVDFGHLENVMIMKVGDGK